MSKLIEHPTFRQVAWIGAGTFGFLTIVGAIWLAVRAQSTDPPPKIKDTSAAIRPGRAAKRPPLGSRPDRFPSAGQPEAPEPAMAPPSPLREPKLGGHLPLPNAAERGGPSLVRPPLPRVGALGMPGMEGAPLAGRLTPEELAKRREERKSRQEDRLKNRIKTLEDRIQSYRKDGTRTEAQIERMEKSLERMRQRLGRMDDSEREP